VGPFAPLVLGLQTKSRSGYQKKYDNTKEQGKNAKLRAKAGEQRESIRHQTVSGGLVARVAAGQRKNLLKVKRAKVGGTD